MGKNRKKSKQRQAKRKKDEQLVPSISGQQTPPPPEDTGHVKAVEDVPKPEKKPKDKEEKTGKLKRFMVFLRASWAELKRVQWPNRQELITLTGIVLGFVLIAGSYLGALDFVFSKLVNSLL